MASSRSVALVSRRLDWIQQQIEHGYSTYITISCTQGAEKIKVAVDYDKVEGPQPVSMQMLDIIRGKFDTHSIVDKGHGSYSTSKSCVAFWLRPRPSHDNPPQQGLEILSPPAPPPIIDQGIVASNLNPLAMDFTPTSAILAAQQSLIENQSKTVRSLSLHLNASESHYFSRSQALTSQLQSMTGAIASAVTKMESLLNVAASVRSVSPDIVSNQNVATQVPDRMKRYQFRRSATNVNKTVQSDVHVQTCINVVDSAVQNLICRLEDAGTQVTARMIADEFPDSDLVMLSVPPGEENCESESDANFDPDVVETSSEEEEEYVSVSESIKKSSRFWHKRVYESATRQKGTVVDVLRGVDSNTVVYAVRFDDGEYDDRISRDEVKTLTAAYVALKDSSKSKSASSKSR